MEETKIHSFSAIIKIIGINPYVSVPDDILQAIFKDANKEKGQFQFMVP